MNTSLTYTKLYNQIEIQMSNDLPFVVYKLPEKQTLQAILQKDNSLNILQNMADKGFIFSPFSKSLPALIFKEENCQFISSMIEQDLKANKTLFNKNQITKLSETQRAEHINLVTKGLNFLKKTGADKVVLSRRLKVAFKNLNKLKTFTNILSLYPEAMVYFLYHPKIGIWMGASPEILVKVKDKSFETMALAGTKPIEKNIKTEWSSKDKREQQYVTDFLIESLNGLLDQMKISKTKTIKAGNLLHLCTNIKGQIKNAFQLKEIIEKIHPTPAVCGLPQKEAKGFIEANELTDRKYYTGFFGELNLDGRTNLYVNLRCMEVCQEHLNVFIGGGITLESRPEDEFLETVAKSRVMLNILA